MSSHARSGNLGDTRRTMQRFPTMRFEARSKPGRIPLGEIAAVLAALAGVFGGLLYLAGRAFASGYFGAMNIPDYQVRFSLQDYGTVSWLPLFLFLSLRWALVAS